MARGTNLYFNHFGNTDEQNLINDLAYESIKMYGIDVGYMAKTYSDTDDILNETSKGYFAAHSQVVMYIRNVDGFEGEGDFLSKFGVEQRDTMTMSVARLSFEEEVGSEDKANIIRPREGDVIYFPLNKKLYTISFVEHEPVFYQMGALQFYELRLEMFEYSGERLNTGLYEIDKLETRRSMDTFLKSQLVMETGDPELPIHIESGQRILLSGYTETDQDDITDSENDFFETNADGFLDFSDGDPFSEGGNF